MDYLATKVAQGGGKAHAGNYLVAYSVEDAEGYYEWKGDGQLHWRNPGKDNAHIEIAVADGADGRFIPDLTITASVVTPDGQELGPYPHAFMWHPMVYHYARDSEPTFLRHDEVNGKRYLEPVDVVFENVHIELGKEPVDPPA